MAHTVPLSASADYGHNGQYLARITGRDPKFTFSREFLGRKSGKRGDRTEADVDEPGLYLECDVTRKGKVDRYWVVYEIPSAGLSTIKVDKDDAMALARRLDGGALDWTREALTLRLAAAEAKDQDAEIEIKVGLPGLEPGKTPRRNLTAALRRMLEPEPEPTDADRAEAIARVRALMVELGVTIEDLS